MPPTSLPAPEQERWRRLETICDAALKLEGAGRAAYLDTACGGDASLRAAVEDLLAHERTAERFLDPAAGAMAAAVASGASLSGRRLGDYAIGERLGEGGMGVVYRARDTRLDRDVALKLVADGHITADGGSRRLRHEARAAARLNHPNICTVYEVASINGASCIAMELVEGMSLRAALAHGALPADRVRRIGHQLADALDHAHAHGVTHRDLKSSNIMLRPDGRVKVIDFGIADRAVRPGDQTDSPRTRAARGSFMGTLAYVAPEVLQGAPPMPAATSGRWVWSSMRWRRGGCRSTVTPNRRWRRPSCAIHFPRFRQPFRRASRARSSTACRGCRTSVRREPAMSHRPSTPRTRAPRAVLPPAAAGLLAFYAARSGNRDVWTVPSAGGPWRQITTNPGVDWHPRWSFDGNEILYTSRQVRESRGATFASSRHGAPPVMSQTPPVRRPLRTIAAC